MLRRLRKTLSVFIIVIVFLALQQDFRPAVEAASMENAEVREVEIMRDPEEADIFSVPGVIVAFRDPEEADIF